MKTMKLSRALVAVLLVCALLFSWSPVRAEAVTTGAVVSVAALTVIAGILIAEGIRPGSNFDEFNALVKLVCDAAAGVGWVVNGFCELFYDGSQTYVDVDFAQFVKDWIWSEGILSAVNGASLNSPSPTSGVVYADAYSFAASQPFAIHFDVSGVSYIAYSNKPFVLNSNASYTSSFVVTGGDSYWFWSSNTDKWSFSSKVKGFDSIVVFNHFGNCDIVTSYDLTLGDVAGPYEDLATGYPEWAGQSVALTPSGTDTVITGYPVSTPAAYEEAITQTQTEAQSGTTSITDSDIGSDVVVEGLDVPLAEVNTISFIDALGLSDLLVTMQALPQAIGTTFTDALTAVFVPSADYLTVKVESLRERFGFIDSIFTTGEFLRDSVSGASGPPVIYVDLGAADGNINYGGKVLLTDFSWYEPYKPTVDSVLGAACWAFFGWRVFMRLPGIIGGESGYVESAISLYDFHKAARDNDSPKKKKGG